MSRCRAVRAGLFADAGAISTGPGREIRRARDDRKMTPGRKVTKTSTKLRVLERDYSHRLLIDKLGGKPGQKIAALGEESAGFLAELAGRVAEHSRAQR